MVDAHPPVVEHVQPHSVAGCAPPAPAVTYVALAPVVEDTALVTAKSYAVPAPAVEYVSPAPAVINAAAFVALLTPTPVRVGDTGFDNMSGRHCEVMRIGDRAYEGQVRILYAEEDPYLWASGTWIRLCHFRPDGKRARFTPYSPFRRNDDVPCVITHLPRHALGEDMDGVRDGHRQLGVV